MIGEQVGIHTKLSSYTHLTTLGPLPALSQVLNSSDFMFSPGFNPVDRNFPMRVTSPALLAVMRQVA